MTKFEQAVLDEVTRLRYQFASIDLSNLHFGVRADGRVDGDNIKIKFTVGDNSYGSDTVSGNSVDEVVREFLRRRGWTERNDGLALLYVTPASDEASGEEPPTRTKAELDDEIPL